MKYTLALLLVSSLSQCGQGQSTPAEKRHNRLTELRAQQGREVSMDQLEQELKTDDEEQSFMSTLTSPQILLPTAALLSFVTWLILANRKK